MGAPVPEPVLAALDRLNGHARAWGCGRRAIYAYKTLAAIVAAQAGDAFALPVAVETRCTSCSGSGIYRGCYYPDDATPCRRCHRTGRVTLRFVETVIGAWRWHHPWPDSGIPVLRAAWKGERFSYDDDGVMALSLFAGGRRRVVWEDPGDWTPNRAGERLAADPAAALLNLVETWLEAVPPPADDHGWRKGEALRLLREYRLDLGQLPGPCCICGSEAVTHSLGFMPPTPPLLHWARPVCDGHRGLSPREWPSELPEQLLGPAVRAWIENPARAPLGEGPAVRAPASAAPADDERRRFRGPGSQAAQAAGTPVPAADRAQGGA